jgi:hypothetical protein
MKGKRQWRGIECESPRRLCRICRSRKLFFDQKGVCSCEWYGEVVEWDCSVDVAQLVLASTVDNGSMGGVKCKVRRLRNGIDDGLDVKSSGSEFDVQVQMADLRRDGKTVVESGYARRLGNLGAE